MRIIARFSHDCGVEYARGLAVWKEYLLVAAGASGLHVLNRENGRHVATVSLGKNAEERGFARSVSVYGNYAYVAKGTAGISFVNLVTGQQKHISTRSTGGDAYAIVARGEDVYIANGTQGVCFVSQSGQAVVHHISTRDERHYGQAVDITLTETKIFIANAAGGLFILDLDTNEHSIVSLPGHTGAVCNVGDKLYVWSGWYGLLEFDEIGRHIVCCRGLEDLHVHSIRANDECVNLACGQDGLVCLKRNQLSPRLTSSPVCFAWDVAVVGHHYIAAGQAGVVVLNSSAFSCPGVNLNCEELGRMPTRQALSLPDLAVLRDFVGKSLGFFFSKERTPLLQQEIRSRMKSHGLYSIADYVARLKMDAAEFDWLLGTWAISASWLMRDSEIWHDILVMALTQSEAQDSIEGSTRRFRVWCAGCAQGQEAVTCVINFLLLFEHSSHTTIEVLGTDLVASQVEKAKRGTFDETQMQYVPCSVRSRYFVERDYVAVVKKEVTNRIVFRAENILQPSLFTRSFGPDIVFCRNVFQYLDSKSKDTALDILTEILVPGGYLVLDPWAELSQDQLRVLKRTDARGIFWRM